MAIKSAVVLFGVACAVLASSIQVPDDVRLQLDLLSCKKRRQEMENVSSADAACSAEDFPPTDWNAKYKKKLPKPTLYCRQQTMIAIELSDDKLGYVIEIRSEEHADWKLKSTTLNGRIIILRNLTANTNYSVRAWGLSSEFEELFGPSDSEWMTTLQVDYDPLPVDDLKLDLLLLENEYYGIVSWNISKDMSCFYGLLFIRDYAQSAYAEPEVIDPTKPFEMKLPDLHFDSKYAVGIRTKSSNWMRESNLTWKNFTTPTCLEVHKNLNKCVPEEPEDLKVVEEWTGKYDDEDLPIYNIFLKWSRPTFQPQMYSAHFVSFQGNAEPIHSIVNESGDATNILFENMNAGISYEISLRAKSSAGSSKAAIITGSAKPPTKEKNLHPDWDSWRIFLVIILPVIIVLLFVILSLLIYKEYNKNANVVKRHQYFEELEMKAMYVDTKAALYEVTNMLKDEWELKEETLILQSILGQGAFGIVRKGWLVRNCTKLEVAVKMLKDEPSMEEMRQFQQEIEIMKSVGKHPNIVSMIGWCTKNVKQGPCLVVEYCSRGDLLTYLRMEWENLTNEGPEIQYADHITDLEQPTKNFTNLVYIMDSCNRKDRLQIKDLISMARQIALGMEYLSNLRVLHRDLAARNILIAEDKTVKVSDFGLSRDVYKDNVYCKLGAGKLPVRWMAIESLTHQRYTTQSDVWSFGILLWEIVTFGSNPYPGIATQEVLPIVKSGYRMERPINCNEELYALMSSCWKPKAKDRPTFTDIRKYLDGMLEGTSDYLKLHVTVRNDSYSIITLKKSSSRSISNERYVKPVSK